MCWFGFVYTCTTGSTGSILMQAAVHPGSVPQLVLLPRRAIVIVVEAFLKDRIPPLRAPVVACMAALRQGLCWIVLDAQRGRHALTHTHITLHVTQASVHAAYCWFLRGIIRDPLNLN
jgi:hypothetical protein